MLILVTYDVNTQTPQGKRRLRQVAKACLDYGVRVQHSVFECVVDTVQSMALKKRIEGIIDPECDSVRYYNLGKNGRIKVTHVGAKPTTDVEDVLIV